MNEAMFYIWLAVGLVPYRIESKRLARRGRVVKIRSLFWSLEARFVGKRCMGWTLYIPLIERVRDAVWAAVMRLRGNEPPES